MEIAATPESRGVPDTASLFWRAGESPESTTAASTTPLTQKKSETLSRASLSQTLL